DRVRSDGDDGDGFVVRRETHAVHEHLPAIERTKIAWLRIAETDDSEKPVGSGVGHRYRIRELLGRVDAIAIAYGNLRISGGARSLTGKSRRDSEKRCACQK